MTIGFGPDTPFFIVLDPRPGETLDDIVLEGSLRKLGELDVAGMLEGRRFDIHFAREDAVGDGQRRMHEILG